MRKPIGEAPQRGGSGGPATVPALLRTLHVGDKSVEAQKAALRGWLTDHPPSRDLVISLLSNGYGILLGNIVAKRPKPPITAIYKLGA
jgi:hypothetical protein